MPTKGARESAERPRWNKCKRRLPALNLHVLFWHPENSIPHYGYLTRKGWVDAAFHELIKYAPTHWMRLPKPPEVKARRTP